MYANYFYDTSVIFSNSIITICIGHDRRTDVIGLDCVPKQRYKLNFQFYISKMVLISTWIRNSKMTVHYYNYSSVLSKFVGPVGQLDIFYKCPTKKCRVLDQMSDRKYKDIHFVE